MMSYEAWNLGKRYGWKIQLFDLCSCLQEEDVGFDCQIGIVHNAIRTYWNSLSSTNPDDEAVRTSRDDNIFEDQFDRLEVLIHKDDKLDESAFTY